ncbi:hypothetical protein RSSM_03611 [Rhodopirellula sallentina SM41]|uniref:Uncharacterized protein n=1 Tax=Rhodopirellula sallentina SM41 TaxID=1263870 RepID=M5U0G1_9BACT|nr:hypothetical protein RSSM_03611 [Rhodopirellula sallentina SM41]
MISRRQGWKRQNKWNDEVTAFDHERERYTRQAKGHNRVITVLRAKLESDPAAH